ncbi:GYDIA family GHMP kinase [Flavobacterium sp.]|uniref:GYDIA family GHMP kinase n=1 Tax=Flavobacterium sp. TaxID=239 RepID=UPI002614EDFB|nr:GYDIA family GHMP kinase [Flavobacterium sp.]
MKQTFYSNGKLLITGEYVVLDGAQALALPTRFGQTLHISSGENQCIQWTSFDHDKSCWFEATIPFESIIRKTKVDAAANIKNTLIEILHEAYLMNSELLHQAAGFHIETELSFPKNWGLGTSSTLINNIAQWAKVDAFTLLKRSFGGSGYDVACAQNNAPIRYQLQNEQPVIQTVSFAPAFTEHLFFVYLNQKRSSKAAIAAYLDKQGNIEKTILQINAITQRVIAAQHSKEFAKALREHEIVLSDVLEEMTIQEALFPDFDGVIKSLGAWGGDFVLVVSQENPTDYFTEKGYPVVVPYAKMILS